MGGGIPRGCGSPPGSAYGWEEALIPSRAGRQGHESFLSSWSIHLRVPKPGNPPREVPIWILTLTQQMAGGHVPRCPGSRGGQSCRLSVCPWRSACSPGVHGEAPAAPAVPAAPVAPAAPATPAAPAAPAEPTAPAAPRARRRERGERPSTWGTAFMWRTVQCCPQIVGRVLSRPIRGHVCFPTLGSIFLTQVSSQ